MLWSIDAVASVNGSMLARLLGDSVLGIDGATRGIHQAARNSVTAVEFNMLELLVSFVDVLVDYVVCLSSHHSLLSDSLLSLILTTELVLGESYVTVSAVVLMNNERSVIA